ncbi:MAG: DUF4942 domain-containing protein [Melioribacteraceae bacterium]
MFTSNPDFYPTPPHLISKMLSKITPDIAKNIKSILEPSAGKGDLVERLNDRFKNRRIDISAIEKDENLQHILRGKGIKVIDSDFLSFSGPDKFDLIFANFPFGEGDRHLLKAIEILYSGSIICLINAESIKNPFSSTRKLLVQKLEELNAEIEYIKDAFIDAERKTNVEVALISLTIKRDIESDLFGGCVDTVKEIEFDPETNYEVSKGLCVQELVDEYNQVIDLCINTIINYFRNYNKVGNYVFLSCNDEDTRLRYNASKNLTEMVKDRINEVTAKIRKNFWRRTFELKEVKQRMTGKSRSEFEKEIETRTVMDFTEDNIRQFVLNLIGNHNDIITQAILEVFDTFTRKHHWSESEHIKNVHYFNGWKTNDCFRVNHRIVFPVYGSYGGPFQDWGKWKLDYKAREALRDIDVVMSYFNGMDISEGIAETLEKSLHLGENKAENKYFKITAHKKGTLHLTFKDLDLLARFNRAACAGKNWLPGSYGQKNYKDLNKEEKGIVDSFEGEEIYSKYVGAPLLPENKMNFLLE